MSAGNVPDSGATVDLGTESLHLAVRGSVAWLTLDRPEARNAITWDMYEGLGRACQWLDAHPEVRVTLLRGAGDRAFAAGTDIGQFQAFQTPADALAYEERVNATLSALEGLRCATVALVRGYATGAGALLALACDLRVWAEDGKLGVPIARTVGNCLSMANYARLVDAVGAGRAMELLFTGRVIEAQEALALGLAVEVVPPGRLLARGEELATALLDSAPLTLAVTKKALRRVQAHRRPPEDPELILSCYLSQDFQEGVRAFLEKRKPQWRGV